MEKNFKTKVYQLIWDDLNHPYFFRSYDESRPVEGDRYELVWEKEEDQGTIPEAYLEDLFCRLNQDTKPEDFAGHSLSVSDVIVLSDGEKEEAYYTDSFGFRKLDSFSCSNVSERYEEKLITVLVMAPGKEPEEKRIPNTLETSQSIVGGYIEEHTPSNHNDSAVIICNEEGALMHLPLNRKTADGEVLIGTVFIVDAPEFAEDFGSLSPEQIEKYKDMYSLEKTGIKTDDPEDYELDFKTVEMTLPGGMPYIMTKKIIRLRGGEIL